MNFLLKLFTPVLLKLGESLISKLINYLVGVYDLWVFNKKMKEEDKEIDAAFKDKNRDQAATDLNGIFNRGAT